MSAKMANQIFSLNLTFTRVYFQSWPVFHLSWNQPNHATRCSLHYAIEIYFVATFNDEQIIFFLKIIVYIYIYIFVYVFSFDEIIMLEHRRSKQIFFETTIPSPIDHLLEHCTSTSNLFWLTASHHFGRIIVFQDAYKRSIFVNFVVNHRYLYDSRYQLRLY